MGTSSVNNKPGTLRYNMQIVLEQKFEFISSVTVEIQKRAGQNAVQQRSVNTAILPIRVKINLE